MVSIRALLMAVVAVVAAAACLANAAPSPRVNRGMAFLSKRLPGRRDQHRASTTSPAANATVPAPPATNNGTVAANSTTAGAPRNATICAPLNSTAAASLRNANSTSALQGSNSTSLPNANAKSTGNSTIPACVPFEDVPKNGTNTNTTTVLPGEGQMPMHVADKDPEPVADKQPEPVADKHPEPAADKHPEPAPGKPVGGGGGQSGEGKRDVEDARSAPAPAEHRGDGTYYTPGLGSCGYTSAETAMVAAMRYPKCGTCIRVCNKGRCAVVTVLDKCPSCAPDAVDLGEAAFERIADKNLGRIQVEWSECPCE